MLSILIILHMPRLIVFNIFSYIFFLQELITSIQPVNIYFSNKWQV